MEENYDNLDLELNDNVMNILGDEFLKQIKSLIAAELKKRAPRYVPAIISSVNINNTYDVYIPPDTNAVFTNIKNDSNQKNLQVGDNVFLLMPNGNATNCWISNKMKSNLTTNQNGTPVVYESTSNESPFIVQDGGASGANAPSNTKLLWIDTNSQYGNGVLKYYNGSAWVILSGVWS